MSVKIQNIYGYDVLVYPKDDGFCAEVPELPGMYTYGPDADYAIADAHAIIAEWLMHETGVLPADGDEDAPFFLGEDEE